MDTPEAERLVVGNCPSCGTILAGLSVQIEFEGLTSDEDVWGAYIRVYPKPPRAFSSSRIPKVVKDSFYEGDRALQADANIAACVMFGRALEALCLDVLERLDPGVASKTKPLMLAQGIEKLKEKNVIDARLYDWSHKLRAFRNVAAHAGDITISREDAADLQTFAHAIVEYVYDLAERYNEFIAREAKRAEKQKKAKK